MKNIFAALILGATLSGCTTTPHEPQPEKAPEAPAEERIDYIGLEQTLHMDRPDERLGYKEKAFDTCTAGNGFSHSDNCRREYFVSIHFQLQCRDLEEVPSTGLDPSDIHPIGDRDIKWLLQNKTGVVHTDSDGYSQIRMAYEARPGHRQIKLSTHGQFLYIQASDLTKIVAPPKWCN